MDLDGPLPGPRMSGRKTVIDQWDEHPEKYRLVLAPWISSDPILERWGPLAKDWWAEGSQGPVLRRMQTRINVNNVEARRISFLAAALMRVLQLAEKLVDDAPGGLTRLTRGHLAAVKGVLLACKMPLERWEIELDGVAEDPETAEARRRLGLDVKTVA